MPSAEREISPPDPSSQASQASQANQASGPAVLRAVVPHAVPAPVVVTSAKATNRERLVWVARNILPWVVALVATVWVIRSVLGIPVDHDKLEKLAAAFRNVPMTRFIVASVVLLVLNCAADSFAMLYTFRWFGCRLPYREIFVARAATYILAVVQYYVGQIAILAFLHQRRNVPLARGAGWILFISGINMGVLVLLAAVGLAGEEAHVPKLLRLVPIAVAVGAVVYAIILRARPASLTGFRVLQPLFEMGISGHVKATLVRLPHVLVLILWHFLALRWFGVQVPPLAALVLLPAVFFAAALPISVQGLGLSQAAAVTFFASYAQAGKTSVLAYSLAMTAVSFAVQIGMGLVFLPAGRRLGLSEVKAIEHDTHGASMTALEGSDV